MLAGQSPFIPCIDFLFDAHLFLNFPNTDSIPVFTSSNNVILTPGIDGVLSPKYFLKVVRKSGEILLGEGKGQ